MYDNGENYNGTMPSKRQRALQDEQQHMNYHHNNNNMLTPRQSGPQQWFCNICQTESFYSYEEAARHEATCQGGNRRDETPLQGGGNAPPPPAPVMLALASDRDYLSGDEFALCSSIEMFSSSHNDVQDSSYNDRSYGGATSVGQLGLRCVHCWRSPTPAAPYATIFPGSLNTMSGSIEMMADEHFQKCSRVPFEARDAIVQFIKSKTRRRDSEEDDNLMRFCCDILPRRTGICNMYPAKSGVRYTPPDMNYQDNWQNQGMSMYQDERGMHPPQHYPNSLPETPGRGTGSSSNHHMQSRRNGVPPGPGPTPVQQNYAHAPQSSSPPNYNLPYGQPHHQPPMDGSGYPPHPHSHPPPPPPPPRYDISHAFIRDNMGGWCCRHCSHVPYQYRAPGSVSQNPNPPSPAFIEYHLGMCRYVGFGPPHHHPHHPPPPGSMWPHGSQGHMMPPAMHPPHHDGHGGGHNDPNGSSPQAQTPSDSATQAALRYLSNHMVPTTSAPLVFPEDKALLTDYFYHLIEQLQLCLFSESDRKTRGGKRENVKIGFGGIECKHCANVVGNTLSRKFFWSNVDRLANSFAEIPSHVLKCRNCPAEIKTALGQIKLRHPEQMAQLPRGSQKVFFRRMWRRMHTEQEDNAQDSKGNGLCPIPHNGQGVPLSIPEDHDWLSDMDCFVRKNLEAFCATEGDVHSAQSDRKYPIHLGQVGIRCRHCSQQNAARGNGVSFPYSISGIYESVREFQRLHLDTCVHISDDLKEEMKSLKTSTSLSSVLRRYYVLAAKVLGMVDTQDGIRAGGEIVSIGNFADMIHGREDDDMRDSKRRKVD